MSVWGEGCEVWDVGVGGIWVWCVKCEHWGECVWAWGGGAWCMGCGVCGVWVRRCGGEGGGCGARMVWLCAVCVL